MRRFPVPVLPLTFAPSVAFAHPGHDPVSAGFFHWVGHLLAIADPLVVIATIAIAGGLLGAWASRARRREERGPPAG